MASILSEGVKKPLFKGFSFDNSTEGAESLVAKISEFAHDAGDVSIGMEATGHYWLALIPSCYYIFAPCYSTMSMEL